MRHRTGLLASMLMLSGILMTPSIAFAHWETNLCQTQKLRWTGSSTSY
jgi:hypothetical protein